MVLGLCGLLALPLLLRRQYDYHFGYDQRAWRAARGAGRPGHPGGYRGSPRAAMLPDLLAHHLPLGLTRAQVLAELGPADAEATAPPPAATALCYEISRDVLGAQVLRLGLDGHGQLRTVGVAGD